MFWDTYLQKCKYGKRLFEMLAGTSSSFSSNVFDHDPLPLPEEYGRIEYITSDAPQEIKQEVCDFLARYFRIRGRDPKRRVTDTPILHFTTDSLFENGDKDVVLWIRHPIHGIIATVRYHWIGYFMGLMPSDPHSSHPVMYLVDALCVHPDWRGKKLVEYLLVELHRFANARNIPYAAFLQEGSNVFGFFPAPFRLSDYVYRSLLDKAPTPPDPSTSIVTLSRDRAFTWLTTYLGVYPDVVFIGNPHSKNLKWVFYRNGSHRILVGIQNTHQIYPETNQSMGWITAWFEEGDITNEVRRRASLEITEYIKPDFDWIWMDRSWTGGDHTSNEWTKDGTFRWYFYQFDTCKSARRSYGILI